MKKINQVKFLIERYYQIQEHRIALGNQLRALEESEQEYKMIEWYFDQFHTIEKQIVKDVKKALKDHVMWKWLEDVKGIGPILAGGLLSTIEIEKADHASSVWKYAGLSVNPETGRGERRKKGEKISWNPFLKTVTWKIGESFVKVKGEYRQIYDTSKEFYQKKFPEEVKEKDSKRVLYTKGHIHAMSKRRSVKLFLSHFWAEWRKREGLEVSVPFAHRGEDIKAN